MSAPVVAFKRGPKRPITSRKRSSTPPSADSIAGPSTASSSSAPTVVRPVKKNLVNPLVQGTKRRRDNDEETGGGLDELDYRAEEGFSSKQDNFATRSSDYDLESQPYLDPSDQKKIRLNEDGDIDDGMYRGLNNYLPTINKTREVLDKKMSAGPIRATANVRTITLVDYQPDVCKDYKETGFCGYGDSCKFMHDRGDYLAGWQLDKLDMSDQPQQVEEEEEEVPFACLICRKPFTEPVVTKCGHYFCMNCAVTRFIKSPKCYACGAATNGIFNKAEKILAKMEAKNKRKREERGVVDEEDDGGIQIGGSPSDDEEDGEDGGRNGDDGSEPNGAGDSVDERNEDEGQS